MTDDPADLVKDIPWNGIPRVTAPPKPLKYRDQPSDPEMGLSLNGDGSWVSSKNHTTYETVDELSEWTD